MSVINDPSHLHPPLEEGSQKKWHLFVVDDEEVVRTSLARRLRRDGFDVHEFESGESMVEQLNREIGLPDAFILDFNMTGLNGLETTKIIRQRSASVPIILLTAYPGAIHVDDAKRVGVFRILVKEIEMENLREVIHHALQLRKP